MPQRNNPAIALTAGQPRLHRITRFVERIEQAPVADAIQQIDDQRLTALYSALTTSGSSAARNSPGSATGRRVTRST
jgi:hypothetical protein